MEQEAGAGSFRRTDGKRELLQHRTPTQQLRLTTPEDTNTIFLSKMQ